MGETAIEKLKHVLADFRVKKNVDYCLMVKYGEVHLLCNSIFLNTIQEHAKVLGITFASIHTIPYH